MNLNQTICSFRSAQRSRPTCSARRQQQPVRGSNRQPTSPRSRIFRRIPTKASADTLSAGSTLTPTTLASCSSSPGPRPSSSPSPSDGGLEQQRQQSGGGHNDSTAETAFPISSSASRLFAVVRIVKTELKLPSPRKQIKTNKQTNKKVINWRNPIKCLLWWSILSVEHYWMRGLDYLIKNFQSSKCARNIIIIYYSYNKPIQYMQG